jgi:hypothetical protein
MNNIKTQIFSPFYFEKPILEIYGEDYQKNGELVRNHIAYIHVENPDNPGELYIVFQENPVDQNDKQFKKGVNLKEFIPFLQEL